MSINRRYAAPFLWILAPYVCGILLTGVLPATPTPAIYWLILFLLMLFIAINVFYKRLRIYGTPWLGTLLAGLLLILGGAVNTFNHRQINKDNHFSKANTFLLRVYIDDEPQLTNHYWRFNASVSSAINGKTEQVTCGRLKLYLPAGKTTPHYGDELIVPANYDTIPPPLNPAEFNYRQLMQRQNIHHQAFLKTGEFIKTNTNNGLPIKAWALQLRQTLAAKLERLIPDTAYSAVATTLILGYKAHLDAQILQTYSRTGTIHILSVSGAHVGLVYVLIMLILGFLPNTPRSRLLKLIVVLLGVWGYALLTGLSAPVCRAAIMLSFIIVGKTAYRRVSTLNLLALAAYITLLINPADIYKVGFQLSYLAVAGLIIVQPIIYRKLKFKAALASRLWMICSVSIAAQLVTLPLSVLYFHQIPVYFLISNLFILVPSALIMYGGIICLALPQNWLITKTIAAVLSWLIGLTNHTLARIEHLPGATINPVWITPTECFMVFLWLIVLIYLLAKPGKKTALVAVVCLLIAAAPISIRYYAIGHSSQTVIFSLSKNRCILQRWGHKAIAITDLDSNSKTFAFAIMPYLDSCHVTNLHIINADGKYKNKDITYKNHTLNTGEQKITWFTNGQHIAESYGTNILMIDARALKKAINKKYLTHYKQIIIDNAPRGFSLAKQQIVGAKIYLLSRNKAIITASKRKYVLN